MRTTQPESADAHSDLTALRAHITELEHALTAERAQRVSYDQILSNVSDAIIVVDLSLRIQSWNAAAERMYGWSVGDVLNQPMNMVLRTAYLDTFNAQTALALVEEEGVWIGKVVQRHRDGQELLIESAVRYLRDDTGNIVGLVGINRDITVRQQVMDALQISEANLQALFDSAQQAYYLLDRDYHVLAFNRVTAEAIEQIWKRTIQAGDPILQYVNPPNRAAFMTNYQRCLTGEAICYEQEVTYPNGQREWYELSYMPVYRSADEISGVVFSGLNITARKKAEQALAQREAQLSAIIGSAMDAIITLDADQRVVLFNRAAEQMFGWRETDILGKPVAHLLPEGMLASLAQDCPALTTVTTWPPQASGTLTALHASGTTFPIEASMSQIKLGETILCTVIVRDLTERQRLQAQLLQSQKMESVGLLAGGIAHDFNNLLMAILGYSDLLRNDVPPNSPLLGDIDEIYHAAQRASALTTQLLAFARKQVMTPSVVDLRTLLTGLETLLRRLISESITVEIYPGACPLMVRVDPGQIEQVLVNLAVNARDAMPHGGTFSIIAAVTTLNATVSAYNGLNEGSYVQLTVSDNGVGMTAEVQQHIFEPFFTTKEVGKGTGLGLATCYGIIKEHCGAIICHSVTGHGTTFTIYLPMIAQPAPQLPPQQSTDVPRHGFETVLLIEDESSVRSLIARVLKMHGYTVLEAATGEEAVALLTRKPERRIDLVLSDMVMPGMSGPDIVERIRAARQGVRVLFMSGYTDSTPGDGGGIPDGVPFLQKPVAPHVLLEKVRAVLDG